MLPTFTGQYHTDVVASKAVAQIRSAKKAGEEGCFCVARWPVQVICQLTELQHLTVLQAPPSPLTQCLLLPFLALKPAHKHTQCAAGKPFYVQVAPIGTHDACYVDENFDGWITPPLPAPR